MKYLFECLAQSLINTDTHLKVHLITIQPKICLKSSGCSILCFNLGMQCDGTHTERLIVFCLPQNGSSYFQDASFVKYASVGV